MISDREKVRQEGFAGFEYLRKQEIKCININISGVMAGLGHRLSLCCILDLKIHKALKTDR